MNTSQDKDSAFHDERRILDALPASTLITRISDGTVLFANQASAQLLGYTEPAGLVGKQSSGFYWEVRDRQTLLEQFRAKGSLENYPVRYRRADGSLVWVSISLRPFELAGEEVLIATIIDITESRKSEEAIRQAEARFHSVFDTAKDAILLIQGTTIIDCNLSTAQIFGGAREQVVGQSPITFSPDTQPDGQSSADKATAKINLALANQPQVFEWKHKRLDGALFDAEVSLTRVEAGEVVYVQAIISDITERRKTEQKFQESQHLLQSLINNFPDGVWVKDLEGHFLIANRYVVEKIYGATADQVLGKTVYDTFPKEVADALWGSEKRLLENRETLSVEERVPQADGKTYDKITTKFPLYDAEGKINGLGGVLIDITERKQAEDLIKASQQKLSLMVETSPLAVIEWNANFEVVSWNPAAKRIFGYTLEEAQGKHARLIIPPEYHAVVDQVWEGLISQTGGARSTNANLTKDGRAIICEWYNTPLVGPDGKVFGASSLVEDITERKRIEADQQASAIYARSLIEASLDPLVTISADGKITDVNQTTIQITGVPRETLIGSDFSRYFTEPEKAAAGYQQVFAEGIVRDYPLTLRGAGGELRDVLYNASVYRDANDNVQGVFAAARDITERKRLEHEIQLAFERRGYQVQVSTEITQEIAAVPDLGQLFQKVVTSVKERLGYYHTQLLRYDPGRDAVILIAGYGETGVKMLATGHHMEMGRGIIGTAAASGETVMRPNLANDPDWQPNPLLPETKGELAVPIKMGGQIMGVLDVQSSQANALSDDDRLLLEGLCGQIAIAMEQTRLREEMAERLAEINRLYRAMSREGWQAFRQTGDLPEGFVYDQMGVTSVANAPLAEELFSNVQITVPGGEVIGNILVENDPLHPFSGDDQAFLQQISEQIALALESARLFEQTQTALAQTEKLSSASLQFARATDLQDVLKIAVEALAIPKINRAILATMSYTASGALEGLTVRANWWNQTGHEATKVGTHYSAAVLKVLPLFLSSEPVFFDDAFTDERADTATRDLIERQNIRSIAVLPLYLGEQQIGVVLLETEDIHHFTQDETNLFKAMGPQISTVLENRRQFERAQRQAERESMLNLISQKIQSATSVEDVLQIAARELGHALGAPMTIAQLSMKGKK